MQYQTIKKIKGDHISKSGVSSDIMKGKICSEKDDGTIWHMSSWVSFHCSVWSLLACCCLHAADCGCPMLSPARMSAPLGIAWLHTSIQAKVIHQRKSLCMPLPVWLQNRFSYYQLLHVSMSVSLDTVNITVYITNMI